MNYDIYQFPFLPLDKKSEVRNLANKGDPGNFYVVLLEELDVLNDLQKNIQKYSNKVGLEQVREEDLHKGYLCLSKGEKDDWKRVLVEGNFEGEWELLDVDTGRQVFVSSNSIFKIPSKFRNLEFCAVQCRIEDVTWFNNSFRWSKSCRNLFRFFLQAKKLEVKVTGFCGGHHLVKLYSNDRDVGKILISKSLASSSILSGSHFLHPNAFFPTSHLRNLLFGFDNNFLDLKNFPELKNIDGREVRVGEVISPNLLWVVPSSLGCLEELEEKMNSYYSRNEASSQRTEFISKNNVYACKFPNNQIKRILALNDNCFSFVCFLLDYGIIQVLEFPELFFLSPEFSSDFLSFQAFTCSLGLSFSSEQFISQDGQYLSAFSKDKDFELEYVRDEGDRVVVNLKCENEDLKNHIIKFISIRQKLSYSQNNHQLKSGDEIKIVSIETYEKFYIQVSNPQMRTGFRKMMLDLKNYCSKCNLNKDFSPPISTPVGALFGNIWARGVVKEKFESVLKIYFVDFGQTKMVDRSKCMLLEKFLVICFPVYCIQCSLFIPKPDKENSENINLYFKDKCLMKAFNLFKVEKKFTGEFSIDFSGPPFKSFCSIIIENFFNQKNYKPLSPTISNVSIPEKKVEINSSNFSSKLPFSIGEQVIITHIVDPSHFYIHRFSTYTKLQNIKSKITDELSAASQYFPEKVGKVVASFSKNTWHRAQVINIDKDSFKVFYLDIGNIEEKKSEDLRLLSEKVKDMPSTSVIRCSLECIEKLDIYEKSFTEWFKNFTFSTFELTSITPHHPDDCDSASDKKTIFDKLIFQVELFSSKENVSLVTLIRNNGFEKYLKHLDSPSSTKETIDFFDQNDQRFLNSRNNFSPSLSEKKFQVSHIISPSEFWLQDVEEYNLKCSFQNTENFPILIPEKKKNYLFKDEENLKRVNIIENLGNQAKVQFIDFGYEKEVPNDQLYQLNWADDFPPLASKYCLRENKSWSEESKTKFKDLLKDEIINIKLLDSNADSIFVDVFLNNNTNVYDELLK